MDTSEANGAGASAGMADEKSSDLKEAHENITCLEADSLPASEPASLTEKPAPNSDESAMETVTNKFNPLLDHNLLSENTCDGLAGSGEDSVDATSGRRGESEPGNSENDAQTTADSTGEEAVRFKRLKLSHRSYRSHDEVAVAEKEEDDDVEMHAAPGSTRAEVRQDSDSQLPALDQIRHEYLNPTSSESSEEDEIGAQRRGSRVTARRIVRAEDLDLSSSETSSDNEDEDSNHHDDDDVDDEADSHHEEEGENDLEIAAAARELLQKLPPSPRFNFVKDYQSRQLGRRLVPRFTDRFSSSLEAVKRLEVQSKLNGHDGCVNALHFNATGTKIASGSDDLMVLIWDWEKERKLLSFNTGHKANVFQSKFLPGDLLVTTCSRDGQVRLAELSVTGSLRGTKKLVQHRGPVHKLALVPEDQHLILSAGEDGQVVSVDLREEKPNKILHLKNEKDRQIPLFSIHNNPRNSWEFCTAGRDQYMRIFDRRSVSVPNEPVSKFCPVELEKSDTSSSYLTAAVFNHDGSEILGSYNDDDIYLFPTSGGSTNSGFKRYRGHRNSATVKGVNFYGAQSDYVISGSDCGNIFFWNKETEAIVNIVAGDERGVVNVLENHPSLPVLATSGLDEDVKVWTPTLSLSGPGSGTLAKEKTLYISKTVYRNLADQEKNRLSHADSMDGQMLFELWRHIRRASRQRRRRAGEQATDDDTEEDDGDDDDNEDGDGGPAGRAIGCVQS